MPFYFTCYSIEDELWRIRNLLIKNFYENLHNTNFRKQFKPIKPTKINYKYTPKISNSHGLYVK